MMGSALRQQWILIRRFGESATELCVLPVRSAGPLLCRPCARYGRVGERRVPASWARSRDIGTERRAPARSVAARGKPVVLEAWYGRHVHSPEKR